MRRSCKGGHVEVDVSRSPPIYFVRLKKDEDSLSKRKEISSASSAYKHFPTGPTIR